MSENPYRLARDIRGIGFKSADVIASKLGIEKTAMIRVRAGISYALTEAMDEGHCGLPTDELIRLAESLLEVTGDLVRSASISSWPTAPWWRTASAIRPASSSPACTAPSAPSPNACTHS
jgi:ATP-dependent exoDNAse (exonuclease V) alpha subunit